MTETDPNSKPLTEACPACHGVVALSAPSCPHCGARRHATVEEINSELIHKLLIIGLIGGAFWLGLLGLNYLAHLSPH